MKRPAKMALPSLDEEVKEKNGKSSRNLASKIEELRACMQGEKCEHNHENEDHSERPSADSSD